MTSAPTTLDVDQIDLAILDELERDGRLSNVELADRVGLSPSPVLRRVRRLEEAGIILGYRAVLDADRVGRGFLVFIAVELAVLAYEDVVEFERLAMELEPVIALHHMAGNFDYLLRVEVRDLAAYDAFTRTGLTSLPGVRKFTSHIVMSTSETRPPVPPT